MEPSCEWKAKIWRSLKLRQQFQQVRIGMRSEQRVVPDVVLLAFSARIGFRPGRQSRTGRFGDWRRGQEEPICIYRIAVSGIGKQPTFGRSADFASA